MREERGVTQLRIAFLSALQGQNFSPKTIRSYGDDLSQFLGWLRSVRVDYEKARRLGREDVEGFLSHLAGKNLTGLSRARKLAAIRKFFAFLVESGAIGTNPALTVKGVRREEKEPAWELGRSIYFSKWSKFLTSWKTARVR
jgi:site-specific recombinase XerD